eukprot:TRINITY_DN12526_c1_g1_i1.p4 TRINITY_DN12526_c1_g1~~TRINITY_DN12526_c1_g1_i1.p4  ORF type:complete len:141 (+),score=3.61 TRINITY_DN12526_c1_g1_i1:180-602(+)
MVAKVKLFFLRKRLGLWVDFGNIYINSNASQITIPFSKFITKNSKLFSYKVGKNKITFQRQVNSCSYTKTFAFTNKVRAIITYGGNNINLLRRFFAYYQYVSWKFQVNIQIVAQVVVAYKQVVMRTDYSLFVLDHIKLLF